MKHASCLYCSRPTLLNVAKQAVSRVRQQIDRIYDCHDVMKKALHIGMSADTAITFVKYFGHGRDGAMISTGENRASYTCANT